MTIWKAKSGVVLAAAFCFAAGMAGVSAVGQSPANPPADSQPPATGNAPAATPGGNAFPEDVSKKAADEVKQGKNPIPADTDAAPADKGPNPFPGEKPAGAPAGRGGNPFPGTTPGTQQGTTPPAAGGAGGSNAFPEDDAPKKLVLPQLPMIPSHEDGAAGPDAPTDDGVSSSTRTVVDPDDLDEVDAAKAAAAAKNAKAGGNAKPDAPGPADPSRRQLTLKDVGSSGAAPAHRAGKDLGVADFYAKNGNYMGAYLRYKDAVAFAPDDADAHYGMATMARKLGKKDEAIAHFEMYLKLDPDGKKVKDSLRELKTLKSQAPGPATPAPAPTLPIPPQ